MYNSEIGRTQGKCLEVLTAAWGGWGVGGAEGH